jgi:methionyl-tRNA formyltransferase
MLEPDIGLHAAGVIYKKEIIESFSQGILNAHIGILPRYRGRSVMEWSILFGEKTGVSTFFIDENIDTGSQIIHIDFIDVQGKKSIHQAKNYLFRQDLSCYKRAIYKCVDKKFDKYQTHEEGTRFYVMSKLFSSVVNEWLSES